MKKELLVPPAALRDDDAIEMARVWIAERGLHCSLKIGMFAKQPHGDEARAWGIVLADIARHVSNAMARDKGETPPFEILEAIKTAFDEELLSPTSKVEGSFNSGPN